MPCGDDQPSVSSYPGEIDEFPPRSTGEPICPQHINWLQDAMVKVQRVLGPDPLAEVPYTDLKQLIEVLRDLLPSEEPDLQMDFSGLIIEDTGPTEITITCTEVNVVDAGSERYTQEHENVLALASLANPGAGGRMPGSNPVGPNQWWEPHLIADSQGIRPVKAMFVPVVLGPQTINFPEGYDLSHRVGAVRTNGQGRILQFLQIDNRLYYKDSQSAWTRNNPTGSMWVTVSLEHLVSPYAREAMMMARAMTGSGSQGGVNMNIRYPGAVGDRGLLSVQVGATGDTDFACATVPTDASRRVEYRVGGSAPWMDVEAIVLGYIDRYINSTLT